ncbi:MAG TPA: hypothetical protein VMD91_19420 [Candidatus Sulfotelmatobacter sp.]|nr:hypothetical protein [Candidatus Sulfotelmatobacter sp.]
MHSADDFTALMAVMLIFGSPITAWTVSRLLCHRERMEYLRQGLVPPPRLGKRGYRRWYREMQQSGQMPTQPLPPWQNALGSGRREGSIIINHGASR